MQNGLQGGVSRLYRRWYILIATPTTPERTSGHIRFRENVPGSNTKINKPSQITIMLPFCFMLGTSPIMGIASKVVINGARPLVVEYTWLK